MKTGGTAPGLPVERATSAPAPPALCRATAPLLTEADHPPCPTWPERSALRAWTTKLVDRVWLGDVGGLEHLPPTGAFIVVAPHASYLDFFAMAALFEVRLARTLRFWAKTKMVRHPIFRHFCRAAGCLEVGERATHARLLRHSLSCLLEREEPLCIFPEGTRSVNGQPAEFRLGYLKLAAEAGVPVVPVRLRNSHAIWPPGRAVPRRGRVSIEVHEPRHVESGVSGAALRRLNRLIRDDCTGAQR